MAKKHQYKIKSKKTRAKASRKWRHVYNDQLRQVHSELRKSDKPLTQLSELVGQQPPPKKPAPGTKRPRKHSRQISLVDKHDAAMALAAEQFPELDQSFHPAKLDEEAQKD